MKTGKTVPGLVLPSSFEDVLRDLGGFGRFQVLSLALILCLEIPTAYLAFVTIFTGITPKDWECDGESIDFEDICGCNGTLRTNVSSVVSEWGLICDSKWVSDFLTSLQMLGTIAGSIYAGKLSDWYGRKPTLTATMVLMGIATAVSAVATDPYVYGFARLLCGAGLASFLGVTSIYTMEFLTPDMRPLGGAVGPWGEAIMLMSLLAYYIRSWRNLLWANVIPFGLIFVVYPFLPESPRWLLRNQKVAEAHAVINTMARINGKGPVPLEYVQHLAAQETSGAGGEVQRFSYLQFFKLKSMRMTTIYLMGIWMAWSVTTFGIAFNIKNFPGDIYINVMLLGATDAVGYPMSLLISNRLGRRRSLALFMTAAAIFFVSLALFDVFESLENHELVLICLCLLGKLWVSGARGCVRTITGESYPTSIRGMGACICGVSNGIGAALAPQLAFLGSQWPSVPYFSFAVISVGGAAISFLLKETHGMALQDEVKAGEDDSIQPSQTDATPGDDQRISTIAFDNNNSADKMENGSAAAGIRSLA